MKKTQYSSKTICILGMLIAITVVMASFFTFRIGSAIKIPTKFLPVSVTAMLFGPVGGGLAGVISDLLAYLIQPAGAFLPQITFVELLYGVSYGFFLRNVSKNKSGYIRAFLCVIFQIIFLNILLTSYFLIPIMNMGYKELIILRLPSAGINMLLQLFGMYFTVTYSDIFRKLTKRGAKQ